MSDYITKNRHFYKIKANFCRICSRWNHRVGKSFGLISKLRFVALVAALAACTGASNDGSSGRARNGAHLDMQRFVVTDGGVRVHAEGSGDVPTVRARVARVTREALSRRADGHWVTANALPWLSGARAGRAFLEAASPRALVRGLPARACPLAHAAQGGPDAATAAERAVRACLAEAPTGCGCAVVAVNDVVFAPRESLAYATGVSIRIRLADPETDLIAVAEEVGPDRILIRDLSGPIGHIDFDGETVTVEIAGETLTGRARAIGYRRGRIAWAIAAGEAGRRMRAVIGLGPEELAAEGARWLAWESRL